MNLATFWPLQWLPQMWELRLSCTVICEFQGHYSVEFDSKCIVICTAVISNGLFCEHFFSYIRTDTSQESTLSIPVGNVTVNTELSYEFGVRKNFKFSNPPQNGTCDWINIFWLLIIPMLWTLSLHIIGHATNLWSIVDMQYWLCMHNIIMCSLHALLCRYIMWCQ